MAILVKQDCSLPEAFVVCCRGHDLVGGIEHLIRTVLRLLFLFRGLGLFLRWGCDEGSARDRLLWLNAKIQF